MEYKGLLELKKLYIDFFKEKGHLNLESFSLVPKDDFSLLFINSGMAPMKKWFLGQEIPPRKRVVTAQRCIRTGDLERVGKTDRHGTFFEMLGNFSFGDYFKRQAIFWAYEFVVDVLKMPKEKIYVTVYKDDDEAYSIWEKEVLVPSSHIVRLGKEDNFWEIGNGPCGPCSELYYDRGVQHGCGKEDCKVGCECDRFIEFWNLVFSQYNNKGDGNYEELEQKNIDTGMGLERLACIFQGVDNLFEVDTIKEILDRVCFLAGVQYKKDKEKDVLIRIITDHIRSIVYLICDGVIPANEGRGYVLKRLIRRAHKSGRKLLIKGNFLSDLAEVVVKLDDSLKENLKYIKELLNNEGESFEKILRLSEEKVLEIIRETKNEKRLTILSKSNEFFLKATAAFLAFEEEISGFFRILKIEMERFFIALDEKSLYEDGVDYFKTQKELVKTKFFRYVDDLKKFVEIFDGAFKEALNDIFFAEEAGEEILRFISDEYIKKIEKEDLEKKIEKVLTFLKNKFDLYVKEQSLLKEKILVFSEDQKEDEVDLLVSSLVEVILIISSIFKIEIDEEVFLKKPKISSKEAFKLCDTYGMPFDILKETAAEISFDIDEEGFLELLDQQKKRAKEAASFKDYGWEKKEDRFNFFPKTEFVGYFNLEVETKVLGVFEEGEEALVILEKTPIYAVSGGQVSDKGEIVSNENFEVLARVLDCKKTNSGQYIHRVKFLKEIKKGQEVRVLVDRKRREKVKKNHTAAHILQKVLILNLGEHIRQAGQLVDENRLRFDFLHFKPLTKEELKKIEDDVNNVILRGLSVNVLEMEKEKARKEGAIALFDEKYGDIVRVVDISGFSKEFCGGTHVENTSEIGVFRIVSEGSVGSGVRRIEAITSFQVLNLLEEYEKSFSSLSSIFKVKTRGEIEEKARVVVDELKNLKEEFSSLKLKFKKKEFLKELKENKKEINGFDVAVFYEDMLSLKEIRNLGDSLKNEEKNLVALIFVSAKDRFNLLVICGGEAVLKGADANLIIKKLISLANGKGGGKKDFATAGIENLNNRQEIEDQFFKFIEDFGG